MKQSKGKYCLISDLQEGLNQGTASDALIFEDYIGKNKVCIDIFF